MSLRIGDGMVETFFNFINPFSVTFDVVKVGLNMWMNENNFITKQRQHPTRLQSTGP